MDSNKAFPAVSPASAGPGQGPGPLCPQASPIVAPTNYVVNDIYHPQEQPIIHPTEIINQHHCVPIPKHLCTYSTKDVFVRGCRNRGRSSRSSSSSRSKRRK